MRTAFGRLLPREGSLFELCNQHGKHAAEGARSFPAMVRDCCTVPARERRANAVGVSERAADQITAEAHRSRHRTFVTPLDRHQIHRLNNAVDDLLDLLPDTREVVSLHGSLTRVAVASKCWRNCRLQAGWRQDAAIVGDLVL